MRARLIRITDIASKRSALFFMAGQPDIPSLADYVRANLKIERQHVEDIGRVTDSLREALALHAASAVEASP